VAFPWLGQDKAPGTQEGGFPSSDEESRRFGAESKLCAPLSSVGPVSIVTRLVDESSSRPTPEASWATPPVPAACSGKTSVGCSPLHALPRVNTANNTVDENLVGIMRWHIKAVRAVGQPDPVR